ncbi:MAG: alpha/beta hydrolase [Mycobacteriaceae bacterium]
MIQQVDMVTELPDFSVLIEANPVEVHDYWSSLSEQAQQELIAQEPELIGNRDGIPCNVRDKVNRSRISAERTRLEHEQISLTETIENYHTEPIPSLNSSQLWYVNNKLDDLATVEELIWEQPNRYLTILDLSSSQRGLAAIAVRNPDEAKHILLTVPGLNTNVAGSLKGMVSEAEMVVAQMQTQLQLSGKGEEKVSATAYIGYQPPQNSGPSPVEAAAGYLEVIKQDAARVGAVKVSSYLHGLSATAQDRNRHITTAGHSYGSLTLSLALQQGAPGVIGDAIFYGSPGLEAMDEWQLGLPEGHGFVMKAGADPVANSGFFGGDPYNGYFERLSVLEGYGSDGVFHERASTHSDYPRNGSNGELRMSGYNIAVIAAGLPELASR